MKKYTFLLLIGLAMVGCTNAEQDEKIRAFWTEQLMQLLPAPPPQRIMAPQSLPEFSSQTTEEPLTPPVQPGAVQAAPVNVVLFMHPQAPDYLRLKQERFVEKLQRKYAGKITFNQYDVSTPNGQTEMRRFIRARKLQQLTVPALVVGNEILQYPFAGVEVALQKAFAAPVQTAQVRRVKRPETSYQFMEITMEDEPAKVAKINKKVSAKERVYIQRALESARLSNQKTLRDIGQIFGPETQAQAFAIVAKSEKVLQTTALNSESAQKYLDTQTKVLRQQEQMLNKLMQNNARNLRAIRG